MSREPSILLTLFGSILIGRTGHSVADAWLDSAAWDGGA